MVQQRLLDIAIREFGLKGLEGASTREIAAAADTAMSSITYHYGGKEGLYLAAADHIAAQMGQYMAAALDLGQMPTTPQEARASIHRILDAFTAKMASDVNSDWSLFVVREQMNPTEAFERIYGGLMGQMMRRLVELVCIATGRRDAHVAQIATITLFGQVVVIRASRASCLKLLERDRIDPSALAIFSARIAANTDAILDRLIAERQELP
ncbi:CerR family C-terminal domain-containing protein [Sphingomonas oligophenolica]|uniref:CerR family C-terminal domain-containing protein n=1 Tax=Sphingomonas oligophenolica TaxID=301154 RepID=A0ABU9XXA6_9SPHN